MLTYHCLLQPFEVLSGLFPFIIEQSKKQKGIMNPRGIREFQIPSAPMDMSTAPTISHEWALLLHRPNLPRI